MKKSIRKLSSFLLKILCILLVIVFLPFASMFLRNLFPDLTGEIRAHSIVLSQKLQSSNRLEVMTVEEQGETVFDTNVIILGTVGKTSIRYRYTASIGIDFSKVKLLSEEDQIVFILPDPEILNDGIEPIQIRKNNLFSYAIDKSTETMLQEIRLKCRNEYLSNPDHMSKAWDYAEKAFENTVCEWLDDYGARHYRFVFRRENAQQL